MTLVLALALQTLYTDHGDPTAAEQRVLEIINRARVDPVAEGGRRGIPGGITEGLDASPGNNEVADVGARPPLAMNGKLLSAARAHSQDMYTRAFFAHTNPDGVQFWQRVDAAGYNWFGTAENIIMSTAATAEGLGDGLMIDSGYAGRGHRKALLDIEVGSSTYYREIGIGYYSGPLAKAIPGYVGTYRDFLTEDFGYTTTLPFLLGVVYVDANSNSFYDEGEGLAGVSITPSAGTYRAVTASAGGYAFPTSSSGGLNVTFSSTSIPADVVVAVVYTSANQKLDLRISAAAAVDSDGPPDGLPDYWETRFPTAGVAGDDTDNDTYTNLEEFRGGSDPTDIASTPAGAAPPPPPPPPPPAAPTDDSSSGGGCGATGGEALAVVLFLSWRSRRRARV